MVVSEAVVLPGLSLSLTFKILLFDLFLIFEACTFVGLLLLFFHSCVRAAALLTLIDHRGFLVSVG